MKKFLLMRNRIKALQEQTGLNVGIGDIVSCDADHCYVSYSQFIKRHSKYDLHWAYKCRPSSSSKYKILGIYNHVLEDVYDNNDFVIVVEDVINHQIFLMGECGIKPWGSKNK